ncbi:Heterokaryon incompatibility protein (HET) domain containing protein, partial [Hyaloscypha variabilis]
PGETASPASFQTLKRWLDICLQTHEHYGSGFDVPLPSRLLHIKNTGGQHQVRLVQTLGQRGQYMCLSHCWGHSQPRFMLKKYNIQSHYKSIFCESLPLTFQHAIIMTNQLGFEFLWIYSLCIIQDSNSDWTFEASQMAAVYSNSFLTIVASKGSNSESGLFTTLPDKFFPTRIPGLINGVPYFLRQLLPHIREKEVDPDDRLSQPYEELPLLLRGWGLQERILSPRLIHFTNTELIWGCLQGQWCECHHSAKHNNNITYVKAHENDQETRWDSAIVHYSSLSLPCSKDKLPALAGIARNFANSQDSSLGQYLAGLWQKDLSRTLMWYHTYYAPKFAKPRPWRAPSWSWAATDGTTNDGWPSPDGFDISKIDLQLTGPDPFGELLCLHMEVTSRFAHGVLHYPPHLTKHHGIQSLEGTDLQIYRYYQKGEHEHGIQFDPDYDMWSPGHDHLLSGQQVVIVLSNGSFRNLVLRRLERSPTDLPAYERIGSIYSGALRHQWLDENQTRYTFL